jgi:non-heme Fe2+,alpha-ketoglutarate-dependent halogenase
MEYKDIFTSDRDLSFYPSHCDQPIRLNAAQIELFNQQGYLHPLPVLAPDELALHRRLFDAMLKSDASGDGYAVNGYFRTYGGVYDLVTHSVLVDYAQDLLGENLVCWGAHYLCKLPGNKKVITWHQDGPLWPFTPPRCITLWLALDDSRVENGCMKGIPGSHLGGGLEHVDSKVDATDLNGNKIPDDRLSGTPVDIELQAGHASVHSDLLVHGSLPNTSDRQRCGVAISYVPTDVRDIGLGWNKAVVLCRGYDSSGHWQAIPRPQPYGPSGMIR